MSVVEQSSVAGERRTPFVLEQSHIAIPHTGVTGATVLKTVKVPGGTMGKNGMLRITTLWSWNNTTGTKVVQIAFAGSVTHGSSGTTSQSIELQKSIRNRNSESAQVIHNVPNLSTVSGTAVTTIAVDTSVDQDITFLANLSVATDTATLESYLIEVIPGS